MRIAKVAATPALLPDSGSRIFSGRLRITSARENCRFRSGKPV